VLAIGIADPASLGRGLGPEAIRLAAGHASAAWACIAFRCACWPSTSGRSAPIRNAGFV
jgi:hypothetical protein